MPRNVTSMTCPKCQGVLYGIAFETPTIQFIPFSSHVYIACVTCGNEWEGKIELMGPAPVRK